MPISKRDWLRRRLAQAWNHAEEALEDVLGLEQMFRPHHPELADALETSAKLLVMFQELLGDFAEAAWGRRPENWDDWRLGRAFVAEGEEQDG